MKYLKYFENVKDIDPFEEEDWDEEDDMRMKYVGKKLFCLSSHHSGHKGLNVGIFTDKNIGGDGYGIGIRGAYFTKTQFEEAIKKEEKDTPLRMNGVIRSYIHRYGDSLNRTLYTIDELDKLVKDIGYGNDLFDDGEEIIRKLIKKYRDFASSANPDGDRKAGVYVEMDEIFEKKNVDGFDEDDSDYEEEETKKPLPKRKPLSKYLKGLDKIKPIKRKIRRRKKK